MRIPVKEKVILVSRSVNSISQYSFSECLTLLKKLQQLDSLVLQSSYYQYIIRTLEERIKGIAQNKSLPLTAQIPVQPNRITF
jgi:hypothetical protein